MQKRFVYCLNASPQSAHAGGKLTNTYFLNV